jgi:hypothetical protein
MSVVGSLEVCADCGKGCKSLAQHKRWCKGRAPDPPPPPGRGSSPTTILEDFSVRATSDALTEEVAAGLADMRYGRGFDGPDILLVKEKINEWQQLHTERVEAIIEPFLKEGVKPQDIAQKLHCNFFDRLETAKQEDKYARKDVPYLEPRVVDVSRNCKVVSHDLVALLERKLQHDKAFRLKCRATSDRLKTGELYRVTPREDDEISDILEGIKARFHPWLWKPAMPEEVDDFRVPWLFNGDDIEIVSTTPARLHL